MPVSGNRLDIVPVWRLEACYGVVRCAADMSKGVVDLLLTLYHPFGASTDVFVKREASNWCRKKTVRPQPYDEARATLRLAMTPSTSRHDPLRQFNLCVPTRW